MVSRFLVPVCLFVALFSALTPVAVAQESLYDRFRKDAAEICLKKAAMADVKITPAGQEEVARRLRVAAKKLADDEATADKIEKAMGAMIDKVIPALIAEGKANDRVVGPDQVTKAFSIICPLYPFC